MLARLKQRIAIGTLLFLLLTLLSWTQQRDEAAGLHHHIGCGVHP
jgi:predicted metal-dependent TIM-barrel fold hydrolase